MSISGYQDYRKYLRSVLEQRMQVNSRYSMRAFARDLELSSSRLSDILHGHKGLSLDSAVAIAERLGLNFIETRYFCDLVSAQGARTPKARKIASSRIQGALAVSEYRVLKDDEFSLIAQWYHLAILELIGECGVVDPQEIATRLDLNRLLVDEALNRLDRLGLVEKKSSGKLARTTKGTTTSDMLPSEAIRKHHTQMMGRAIEALSIQPIAERDFSSVTVAFDKKNIKEAKKLIEKFKQDFVELCESMPGTKTSVYTLGVQLFNQTPSRSLQSSRKEPTSSKSSVNKNSRRSSIDAK